MDVHVVFHERDYFDVCQTPLMCERAAKLNYELLQHMTCQARDKVMRLARVYQIDDIY
jgi:hypothetical protein